ncbi:hypothetical protein WH52_06335 [Tenacibaculum holothuriorum]|uniref:isochorismate synthase n=1 Tax=Tenacibaculum holothuriorum TaxID=1635173 RepID=A0A1Y2PD62_9FLAO|nr:isochorismate synthase [Tenacibaculum holothuriorum]OSY88375.1 hypothetical protein WH52_06335 [Tenacibaculum holothuriorum]
MKIFNNIKEWQKTNKPFVAYKKPNSTIIQSYFQNDDGVNTSDNFEESGFIFAPFDSNESSIIFSNNNSIYLEESFKHSDFEFDATPLYFNTNESSKQEHLELVSDGIKAIKKGDFKKVVLSRKETIDLSEINIIEIFQRLIYLYSTAMVYVWHHPKIGTWMGATPETLLQVNNDNFSTMSLAGTQLYKGTVDVDWKSKEIEEQQFVTDYILEKLLPHTTKIISSELRTIKAGNLLHLQTKIEGIHKGNIKKLINSLHPTPAVCGLPKEISKDFITKNENYHRKFYTGFLGELNVNKTTNLFVNLRCMEIHKNSANLFIGGGITIDSIPEKEWQETVSKTSTMKKVL